MKNLTFTFLISFVLDVQAYDHPILVELGQEQVLAGPTQKLWIENSKVLSASSQGAKALIKGLVVGTSKIRQNETLHRVVVVPPGSKQTFKDWDLLSQKFLGLRTDICDDVVCLVGKLYRIEDYKRILSLMQKNDSSIYLALETTDSVRPKIEKDVENHFRSVGLTPLKLTYGKPWRIHYSNKEYATDYKMALRKIGVLAIENKQKLEIADNIRVEIKVTEVKKDFGQIIGMKWPNQYQAQVISGNFAGIADTFDGVLNAHEAQGDIKILATPNLLCRSGKEAEFFAGGEFPIKVLNFKFQDIIWKKYGIILKVKPLVDSAGQMSLQIETEVSSIDPSRTIDGIPAMLTNRVSSHFDLIESKTIALSGLIKNESSTSSDGLPFLSRVPILGALFSSKEFKENKSELVIFVTPQLLKNESL